MCVHRRWNKGVGTALHAWLSVFYRMHLGNILADVNCLVSIASHLLRRFRGV